MSANEGNYNQIRGRVFTGVNDYQRAALRTMLPYDREMDDLYCALSLAGEAGEYANMVKKHVWHGHPWDSSAAVEELGDIQWYLAVEAERLGFSLSQVMTQNLAKLWKRYPEGWDPRRSQNR